jgi:hypothetical protein
MPDAVELLFKIRTDGQSELDKVSKAVAGVKDAVKLSGTELASFDKVLKALVGSGASYSQALRDVATSEKELGKAAADVAKELLKQEQELERTSKIGKALAQDNDKLRKSFEANKEAAEKMRGVMESPFSALKSKVSDAVLSLGPLGLGLTAVGIGLGVAGEKAFEWAKAAGELAKEQIATAARTGLTVKEVAQFSRAAKEAGVNSEAFTMSMRTLSQGLSENSDEGKKAKRALEEIGAVTQNQFGTLKSTAELFQEIADKMGAVEDPATKARLAIAIFGRAGLEMLPLLNNEFRDTVSELRNMGIGFDDVTANHMKRFDDALERLSSKLAGFKKKVGTGFAETLQALFPETFDTKDKNGKYSSQNARDAYNAHLRQVGQEAAADYQTIQNGGILAMPNQLKTPAAPSAADLNRQLETSKQQQITLFLGQNADLTAKLKDAQNDLAAAVQSNDLAAVKSAQGRVKAIQAQIDSTRDLDAATASVAALLQKAQMSELTGLARIARERAITIAQLGQTKTLIEQINQAFDIETKHEIDRQREQTTGKFAKFAAELSREGTPFAGGYLLPNKDKLKPLLTDKEVAEIQKQIRATEGAMELYDRGDKDKVVRESSKAQRIADLTSSDRRDGESSEQHEARVLAATNAAYQARIALAEKLFDIEMRRVDRITDADEKEKAHVQAKYEREKAIDDARMDREIKLQEVQKKALEDYQRAMDSYKQQSLQLFDILTSRSPSQGFHQYASNLLHTAGGNLFSRATAPILKNIENSLPKPIADLFGFTQTKGGDPSISKTADNTQKTYQEVRGLRADLAGITGSGVSDPSSNAGGSGGNGNLGTFASDLDGFTGSKPTSFLGKLFGGGSSSSSSGGFWGSIGKMLGFSSSAPPAGVDAQWTTPDFTTLPGESSDSGPLSTPGLGDVSPSSSGGGSKIGLGNVAAAAGGALAAIQGFMKGGVGGDLQGVGGVMGTAAALDPEPISKAILGIGSMVSGLLGGIFGNNPQKRANQITNELSSNVYQAPTAWNVTEGGNGTYEDFDSRGNLRTSSMSAVPTVAEPYVTSRVINGQRSYYNAPGNTLTPYSGGPSGSGQAPTSNAPTTIVIQALDSQSFHDYLQKPGPNAALGAGVTTHLQNSGERLADAIKYHVGNN